MFQAGWLTHPNFPNAIRNRWNPEDTLSDNLKVLASDLKKWNHDCFGNIHRRKNRLWARLAGVQARLAGTRKNHLLKPERRLLADLDFVLKQELMWFQKSREDWINSRDGNTKYYHASTMVSVTPTKSDYRFLS